MNGEWILDALGNVEDAYILEAAPGLKSMARPRRKRWLAAVIAVAAVLVFSQTAPGAAALKLARETAAAVFETLFPPKEITVNVEGEAETTLHTPGGHLPEAAESDAPERPGFVIYYDPDIYEMTETQDAVWVRPIPVEPDRAEIRRANAALFAALTAEEIEGKIDEILAERAAQSAALPPCELEICHLPESLSENAARAAREEAVGSWERVSDVADSEAPAGYFFSASSGDGWDAPCQQLIFTDDGQGGTFRITVRYFREAAEGHGARFLQMLQTFEVLAP